MDYKIACSACAKSSEDLLSFVCSSCGQPLEVQISSKFEKSKINKKDYTVWRYKRFFSYVKENSIVSLGEGWTPLVKDSGNTYFKLEGSNPTGSFKDRGATILISAIHKSVKSRGGYVSEDSSGNAGASIAAYAARAGLKAKIYVPETVSGPKFSQIQTYNAYVEKISGERSKVAEKAQQPEPGKFYIGHILQPLFRDGTRNLAYEIAEQFNWNVPNSIYLPVSAGTLLLGLIAGFRHLLNSEIINSVPRIVACQTIQVSPLYHRFKNLRYTPPPRVTSVADALVSVNPPLLDLMVKRLKEINGDVVIVDETETIEAFEHLAAKGFFVEPSSAVAYAGYIKQTGDRENLSDGNSVVILTGNGLKTTFKP